MAVGGSLALSTSDALAACAEPSPDVFVCTGDTIDAGGAVSVGSTIVSLTNSGTINGADSGVTAGNFGSLTKSGTMIGEIFAAISTNGNIGTLTNTGVIRSSFENGISAIGTIKRLVNAGLIQGANAGISSSADIIGLTNSGTIIGGNSSGIFANGNIGSLVNTGVIRSTSASGVGSNGIITSLVNSGLIVAGVDAGVAAEDLTNLVNSGIIRGGTGGIIIAGGIANLTNAGTIQATQAGAFAIQEDMAANTQLTLNAGSILIGRVDLGGGVNTLNIGAGLSLNSLFESDGGTSLTRLGTTGDALVALVPIGPNSVQVVAVDASAFANHGDAMAALTTGIGQTLQSRQAATRSDPALGFASRFAAAEESSIGAFSAFNDTPTLNPNRFWIEGFGAFGEQNHDATGRDFENRTGGIVAGFDVPLDAVTSVGIMAGFARTTSENEINTQQTDMTSVYGGVYASTLALGLAWDASLSVGHNDYDAERTTANNAVATGLETANADFTGWFINPQVTATRQAANPLAGFGIGSLIATNALEQMLTLSYTGLFLDGYTETGTTSNPLTLNDRDIHLASARAAIALPFEAHHADGAVSTLRLIAGVEGRTQFGDDTVSGTLLGQVVSATLDDDDFTAGAFVGLAGEVETTTGMTAYANVEGLIETDASWQASATAGLRIAF